MKFRIAAALLASLIPVVSGAWVEIGTKYLGAATTFQLGDICDSVRFPLTAGDCGGSAGNPDWRVEVGTAIGRWHAVTNNFHYSTDPGAGASAPGSCDDGDPNSLFFLDDICGLGAFGGTTLAVALTSFFVDGVALHSDVIFNSAFQWDAFDDALSNHGSAIDFRRVAAHELGHVAGLAHPSHTNALMFPSAQDTVISPQPDDTAGMNAIYGASRAFAIPDQNGNSTDELVHIWRASTGETKASIRDSSTGVILKNLTFFSSAYQTVDAVLIPDEDGSGAPELAVLATRISDLRPVVEIRNISGADNPRSFSFSPDMMPIRLKNIGDADGNGVSELAVLAIRQSDFRGVVEIRNSFGLQQKRTVSLETQASPEDMDVLVDPLGINPPRLAVLMFKWPDLVSDGRGFLESRNAFGPQNRTRIWMRLDTTPISLVVINEGGPKAAVLSTRNTDGRTLVEVKSIVGTVGSSFQFWDTNNAAIAITAAGDADGDGHTDLVVLSRKRTNGRVKVEVRNTDRSNIRRLSFAGTFDAIGSLFVLNDTDGDTFPELAALMSHQPSAKAAVYWRNSAGPNQNTATRIWVSPTP